MGITPVTKARRELVDAGFLTLEKKHGAGHAQRYLLTVPESSNKAPRASSDKAPSASSNQAVSAPSPGEPNRHLVQPTRPFVPSNQALNAPEEAMNLSVKTSPVPEPEIHHDANVELEARLARNQTNMSQVAAFLVKCGALELTNEELAEFIRSIPREKLEAALIAVGHEVMP